MRRLLQASRLVPLGAAGLAVVLVTTPSAHAQALPATPPAITPAPVFVDDSTLDGTVIGALAGVGTGIMVVGTRYAICSEGCGGLSDEPSWTVGALAGGGIGAAVGWLIDKVRRDPAPSPVGVTIRADHEERAVHVSWRF